MDRREFESIVRKTIENLPEEFHSALENIAIVVREEPDSEQGHEDGDTSDGELLGLYYGVPLTERDGGHTGIPDRIEIYRGPILRTCSTRADIIAEIRDTVIHELGHHMGLSDGEMPY